MNLLAFADIAPVSSSSGIVAGAVFFLVMAAAAYITFRLLRRTVKFAIRMLIVLAILAIAAAGTIALFSFGYGTTSKSRPSTSRPR